MATEGTQIKVLMPSHLYDALKSEADAACVTMADLVRLAVMNRYRQQETHRIYDAHRDGLLSTEDAADRLEALG